MLLIGSHFPLLAAYVLGAQFSFHLKTNLTYTLRCDLTPDSQYQCLFIHRYSRLATDGYSKYRKYIFSFLCSHLPRGLPTNFVK